MEVEETGDTHGRSLLPMLGGETEVHREFAFSSGYIDEERGQLKTRVAVNSADGWALHFHREYEPELYYVPDDAAQEDNIIADNEEQADRLHGAFVKFLREVGASDGVIEMCGTWRKAK